MDGTEMDESTTPGCPTCAGPSRRGVLRAAGAAAALGAVTTVAGEAVSMQYAFAEPGPRASVIAQRDVLVVLSLRGGFDGLSAVVPAGDPDYYRLRPGIGVPASRLLPLDTRFGLHPAMAPLLPLWRNGSLAAVVDVGQAEPSRSHFTAMAEMERAAPGTSVRSGWIDRMAGAITGPRATPFQVSQVGRRGLLGSLVGPGQEMVLGAVDDFVLDAAWDATERARWADALTRLHAGAPDPVAVPARTALGAVATTARLKDAGHTPAGGAVYPVGDLGPALRDVARLIKADVGLRAAAVDYGDWDLHENMGAVDGGGMSTRLAELAQGLAAFATDLGPAMRRVCLVTLSEFGRRVDENGSGGTDHGHGNTVLLLGGGVVGGRVHGTWPGLSDAALVDGDLPGRLDYRDLLGEVLRTRCGVRDLSGVFPGLSARSLGATRRS